MQTLRLTDRGTSCAITPASGDCIYGIARTIPFLHAHRESDGLFPDENIRAASPRMIIGYRIRSPSSLPETICPAGHQTPFSACTTVFLARSAQRFSSTHTCSSTRASSGSPGALPHTPSLHDQGAETSFPGNSPWRPRPLSEEECRTGKYGCPHTKSHPEGYRHRTPENIEGRYLPNESPQPYP